MFNCKYETLTLSFNEFHFIEKEDLPTYGEFCLVVLKDGSYTAGEWMYNKFVRGQADAISKEDVYAWHSLDRYNLKNCLEDERINHINIGEGKEDGYSIQIKDFHCVRDEQLLKKDRYCLLILNNGNMSGGRWTKWGNNNGTFEHASAGCNISPKKVWAWTALSPDYFSKLTEEKENARLQEEELNKNPTTDPELFKYGIDIEVYYDKALEKLVSLYPWAKKSQMKKNKPWVIVPKSGKYVFAQLSKSLDNSTIIKDWTEGSTADEFIDFLVAYTKESVAKSNPTEKFKYGYDIEVYLKKAFDQVKADYHWLEDKHIKERIHFRYDIKMIDDDWEFIRESSTKEKDDYTVCDVETSEQFIENVVNEYQSAAMDVNPVVSEYKVRFGHVEISGWNLERYEFSKLQTGDYKVYVQAGDRYSGSGRDFFIPSRCFDAATYDEFLDKYQEIVPGKSFGLFKEDLVKDEELKKFLGY